MDFCSVLMLIIDDSPYDRLDPIWLAVDYVLMDSLRQIAAADPVWRTCAGLIFLAKETDNPQPLLGTMDIFAKRNAFGRPVDNFETDLFVDE